MATYANYLRDLIDKPQSYEGSTGYKFGLDQGLQAVNRSNSRMRGSGNALAALTKYATGLAQQDYGNEFMRRKSLADREFDEGLARDRFSLEDRLGTGQLDLAGRRLDLDSSTTDRNFDMAGRRLDLDRTNADRSFGLDAYRAQTGYELGAEQNANARQNSWWNYDLGSRRLGLDASEQENRFNLDRDRNARDWYDARTRRGSARSTDYWRGA